MLKTLALTTVLALAPSSGLALPSPSLQARANSTPIYQDASRCVDERVEDLLSRMTVEEKAGQLFHNGLFPGKNGTLDEGSETRNSTKNYIVDKYMTHFNLIGDITSARETAEFVNRVQKLAESTRLGIPVTLSSDPRHHFTDNVGTGFMAGSFSQWPETLGLAALRDPKVVAKFAEVAREEYMAVGLRAALHPQIDVTTEPRWARTNGAWGENATLTSEMVVPYIEGLQQDKFGVHSITTVTKHFPGGGPGEDGEDSHFTYGKNNTYPGNNFEYHLLPFRAAIAAGTRQIMPAYSRPIGTKYEPVAMGFNKGIITGLLRGELGFDGIVVTDWGLISDAVINGQKMPARAWGLEDSSELERTARIFEAGCDQIGGEQRPELVVELVKKGLVSEDRIDVSVRRVLREKFLLGLFEKRYVDVDAAEKLVGNEYFVRLGADAQRRSYTLLTNKDGVLPLSKATSKTKFYIEGFNATLVEQRGFEVVEKPQQADYALLRIQAPSYPRPGGFEKNYPSGSLEFTDAEKKRQAEIFKKVPTIVDLGLDRAVAIPELFDGAKAVLANYGSSSDAFLDVLLGKVAPEGKLPFDLPRSQKAVEASLEDLPYDSADPVFRFGHGLSYADECVA